MERCLIYEVKGNVPDDEAVRIFIKFSKLEEANKGTNNNSSSNNNKLYIYIIFFFFVINIIYKIINIYSWIIFDRLKEFYY